MKNQRDWDHLDDAIRNWELTYRAHVEEYFWEILRCGLYNCEVKYSDGRMIPAKASPNWIKSPKVIHVAPRIEELLFPQVLFMGVISDAGHEILEDENWAMIYNDQEFEVEAGMFREFLLDRDCCCSEVIESLAEKSKDYILSLMFGTFNDFINDPEETSEEKPLTHNIKQKRAVDFFFEPPAIADLRKEVFELRKMDSNDFAGKVRNMLENAKKEHRILTVKEILEFAYDEKNSPTEPEKDADLSDPGVLVDLRKNICERISGQDPAVRQFINGLFEGQLSFGEKKGPMCTFLFVGPPGVGKTYLSNVAADLLKRPFKIFQMNEYAQESSFQGLIGFEKTYRSSMPGALTSFVKDNPDAILLFDEVEKAHINTIRQFLSVLEGGHLKDLYYDSEIDFRRTICIFTTNAGRDFYEDKRGMKISALAQETIIEAMKKDKDSKGNPTMPPEFLSRLAKGHIIGFDHMEPVKLLPIIKDGLSKGKEYLANRYSLNVEYDEVLLANIFMFKYGPNLDARVASSKSRTFLIDMIYPIMDFQEQKSRTAGVGAPDWENITIYINADLEGASNETARKYLKKDTRSRFIIIDRQRDREMLLDGHADAPFEDVDGWYDNDLEQKKANIAGLLNNSDENVDAILINPFFYTNQDNEYEGVLNNRSHGMELIKWISGLDSAPPVFVVIPNNHPELEYNKSDMDSLWAMNVRGFVHLDYNELCDLAKELFLGESLRSISSKGRVLGFEQKHKKENSAIKVELTEFSEEVSMSPDAVDIFINEVSEHTGNSLDEDVIGAENAKEELKHFIKFLKDPKKYIKSGQSVSRGILLYGPPGTGKTMLAKALAKDADCPFIPVSGAEIIPDIRGDKDDDKVRDIKGLFRLARKYSPSILFIDEIDAFGKPREDSSEFNIRIVNNLLTEMDGFNSYKDKPVFVIAATNAADPPGLYGGNIHLDEALLRRFTKKVYVDLPNEEERFQYLKKIKEKLSDKAVNMNGVDESDLRELSRLTAGHSLAEIDNSIQIAQGRAVELDETNPALTKELIRETFEETIYGERIENAEEHIKTTAFHEAGHAFMAFQREERFWPEYATLIGRGSFLGAVKPREDKGYGLTKEQIKGKIREILAGRAAEIVFNGETEGLSTGASEDLRMATWLAKQIVCSYGMENGFLMGVSLRKNEMSGESEWDAILKGPLAEKYMTKINEILSKELQETIECIRDNKQVVENLGNELLNRSRLTMEEMMDILGMTSEK